MGFNILLTGTSDFGGNEGFKYIMTIAGMIFTCLVMSSTLRNPYNNAFKRWNRLAFM